MLEQLTKKKIVFTSLKCIDTKVLGIRKKLIIYCGVDLKLNYHLIVCMQQKSRFLLRNAYYMSDLVSIIAHALGHNFMYRHILLNAPLCSKAKQYLSQNSWTVYNDFM